MRAMVVDDSKAMRTIFTRVLRECGFDDVIEASSAPAALDALHALEASADTGAAALPAVAVVDWDLPEHAAAHLVDAVRADAAYRDLRVVTIASNATAGAAADADDADDAEKNAAHVVKPFTTATLRNRLMASVAAA